MRAGHDSQALCARSLTAVSWLIGSVDVEGVELDGVERPRRRESSVSV